jgi:hypothetical protein
VITLKGRVDPENAATSTSTLNIVEKNSDYRYISTKKLGQQILIEKDLIYPVFTGRLDRADDFWGMYEVGF